MMNGEGDMIPGTVPRAMPVSSSAPMGSAEEEDRRRRLEEHEKKVLAAREQAVAEQKRRVLEHVRRGSNY